MDYKNYQTFNLEEELRRSEKSVMRSMEAQQKKIMEEKRRRSERNQNLISELNRINRQAAILAAKSERMRMLKKQYEHYLLSLWAKRSQTYSAPIQQTTKRIPTSPSPAMTVYSNVMYQPYNETTNFNNRAIKSNVVRQFSATNPESSPIDLYAEWNNQERSANYGNERHYEPQLIGHGINDSILKTSSEQPTSSSQAQLQLGLGSEKPKMLDIKSSKSFNPIYQARPFEHGAYSKNPTTMPLSAYNSIRPTSYAEVSPTPRSDPPVPNIIISLSDDEDSEKEDKVYNLIQNKRRMSIIKSNDLKIPLREIESFISDDTPAILESTEVKKISTNTIYYSDPPPFIITKKEKPTHVIAAGENKSDKLPAVKADNFLIDECKNDTDKYKNYNEKVESNILERTSPIPQTKFIIPKIIVEPQQTEQPQQTVAIEEDNFTGNQLGGNDYQTSEQTTDKFYNNYSIPHHLSENTNASAFPSEDTNDSLVENSAIYHLDKQSHLENAENLNYQQHPIQHIANKNENVDMQAADNKTIELETNSSNLSVEHQEKGIEEIINNNQELVKNPTSIELNDKINKIYKKIEKIEDEYYGEKVKIVENFDNTDKSKRIMDSSNAEFEAEQMVDNLGNLNNENIQIIQESVPDDNFVYANENEGSDNNNISQTIEEDSIKNWEIERTGGNFVNDDGINENTNNNDNNNVISDGFIYSEDDANRQLIDPSSNERSQENIPTNYEYQAAPEFVPNVAMSPIQQQFEYAQNEYSNVAPNDEFNYVQEQEPQPQVVSYQNPSQFQQEQYDNNYYLEAPPITQENQYGQEYQQEYYENNNQDENQIQQPQIYQDENQIFQPEYIEQQPNDEANMNYLTSEIHNLSPNDNIDRSNVDLSNNFINESQYTNNTNFVSAEYVNNQQVEDVENESAANMYDDNQIPIPNDSIDYSTIEKNEYEQPENTRKYETMETVQKYDTENDSFTTTSTTNSTSASITTNSISTTDQVKKKKSVEFADDIKTNTDNPIEHSKTNEVVMIKQLLGDESDDNSIKSNMKYTPEKDNVDESDFDFSTNSEQT